MEAQVTRGNDRLSLLRAATGLDVQPTFHGSEGEVVEWFGTGFAV